MSVVKIPTDSSAANYNELLSLDGNLYSFRFRYNDRDNSWYLSVFDSAGNSVRSGIKLIPNFSIVRQLVSSAWPNTSRLILLDARPDPRPPKLSDLGNSAFLFYRGDNP